MTLDDNYTRVLYAVLNKSSKQHPIKKQQNGHLPPISQSIQEKHVRYGGHCWWSKEKLKSNFLQWTSTHDTPVLVDYKKLTFISSEQTLDTV